MAETLNDEIKTAYVLNFIKFTEWPVGAVSGGKVTLCVAGKNPLGGMLATLEGRKAGGHVVHVVEYHADTLLPGSKSAPKALINCQALFIGESEQHRYLSLIKSLGGSPVLTISDIDDFAENGGGIWLGYRERKIIFEVNLASVQAANLRLPSQLLNLASYIFRR